MEYFSICMVDARLPFVVPLGVARVVRRLNDVKRSRRRGKFHRAARLCRALRGFGRGVGCRLVMAARAIRFMVPALLVLAPAAARAGGAPFPNTYAVLAPADRPGEIWIPTT